MPRLQSKSEVETMKRFSPEVAAIAAFLVLSLAFAKEAFPQSVKSDHWSRAELMERAKHLRELAVEKGSASEILEKYPHHYTMLAFRNRDGGAEVHANRSEERRVGKEC